jgi:hypothetical protein
MHVNILNMHVRFFGLFQPFLSINDNRRFRLSMLHDRTLPLRVKVKGLKRPRYDRAHGTKTYNQL